MKLILGGGLAGLAAAHRLTTMGEFVTLVERQPRVGGLSQTLRHGPFSFDLGGHRFHTHLPEVQALVEGLLKGKLLRVKRRSQILLNGRYVDYPLRAASALRGVGVKEGVMIGLDYLWHRLYYKLSGATPEGLEEWVVSNFGRRLYNLYFKDYTEKVWGLKADQISRHWISKRIQGINLLDAVRSMWKKVDRRTFLDEFLYPERGIGMIAEALQGEITRRGGAVLTNTGLVSLRHSGRRIESALLIGRDGPLEIRADHYISTIPLDVLLKTLDPPITIEGPSLRYRDLLLVVLFLDKERLTDLTWLYIPDREIPFGRIHEPKNWSPLMAPQGYTHLVVEYFCSRGDQLWASTNDRLVQITWHYLSEMGLSRGVHLLDGVVVRVPHAYPLFERGYEEKLMKVKEKLQAFENLVLAGRTGGFAYLNMDEAIHQGILAAEMVMGGIRDEVRPGHSLLAA